MDPTPAWGRETRGVRGCSGAGGHDAPGAAGLHAVMDDALG